MDIICIKKELREHLDKKRYEHTIGVAYTAASIAMCYQYDMEKALLAGLLHDCAKYMKHSEFLEYCHKNDIFVSDYEEQNPGLLHAKVGSHMAKTVYGIEDSDILFAITYHTTGKPDMSLLEKIIYIADYIEPLRNHDDDLFEIRSLVFHDIDKALIKILTNSLRYLETSGKVIDPMTEKTYQYYCEIDDCHNKL